MKKLIVGVAGALALMSSNAVADGPYRRPPPTIAAPPPVYEAPPTWTGFYFGAGVGAGAVVHDVSVQDLGVNVFSFDGVGGQGIFGTVIVGWDWQMGNTVFGIFADYDFSDISTNLSLLGGLLNASFDHSNSWAIGARLGWLSSPATLWYLTAGYTEAEFDSFASFVGLGLSGEDRFSGYFVGAGVDTRLRDNWFLRLEYRFSQFDSEPFTSADGLTSLDVEPSIHTARVLLTYKFSGSGMAGWGLGR